MDASVLVASLDGGVALVQGATGQVAWTQKLDGSLGPPVHGGDLVYLYTYQHPSSFLAHLPPVTGAERLAAIQRAVVPAHLEARRADDGSLVWSKADWRVVGRTDVALDGDTLFVGSGHWPGEEGLYALDAHTGSVRWIYDHWATVEDDARDGLAAHQRLVSARDGRVYLTVHEAVRGSGRPTHQLVVLQARTGHVLWSLMLQGPAVTPSLDGQLIAEQVPTAGGAAQLILRDARDGTLVRTLALPPETGECTVRDAGLVYVFTQPGGKRTLTALELPEGTQRWQLKDFLGGYLAEGMLVSINLIQRDRAGRDVVTELRVFDTESGAMRWRWRSPENVASLLRLWGPRTPQVVGFAIRQAYRNNVELLRSAIRHRDPWEVISTTRDELAYGQWRHPHAVPQPALAASRDMVFVGTRLGLFALDARDSSLLWHVLPTSDLSAHRPVVMPRHTV